jgi:hypothetical protein
LKGVALSFEAKERRDFTAARVRLREFGAPVCVSEKAWRSPRVRARNGLPPRKARRLVRSCR